MEKKSLVSKKNVLFFSVFLMCISAFCCLLGNNKVSAVGEEKVSAVGEKGYSFKYEVKTSYFDYEKSATI
ncbi:MAG: hypothetical protein LBT82_03130 [Oscillospiraceae bacterium]|jgi:hypothetical protein|nr:hypothetical protein [Oscillospiraceae bacterium]